MLAKVKSTVGIHLDIEWEGWIFSKSLDMNEVIRELHNHDCIHNNKILFNHFLLGIKTSLLGDNGL